MFQTVLKCSRFTCQTVDRSKFLLNSLHKNINNFSNFTSIELNNTVVNSFPSKRRFHVSSHLNEVKGLNEFFDDKDNWVQQEVKVGRPWKMEELRIKSNQDLHKLWFVLLKERNMLLTMEHAAKEEFKPFPNPERIDKVEDSMKNLEEVVKERNKAYMLLETGETGERPSGEVVDSLGRVMNRRFSEHTIPDYINTRVTRRPTLMNPEQTLFFRLLREKAERSKRGKDYRTRKHVAGIISRYPDADLEALKEKYPNVDIDKIRKSKEARGNHDQNVS